MVVSGEALPAYSGRRTDVLLTQIPVSSFSSFIQWDGRASLDYSFIFKMLFTMVAHTIYVVCVCVLTCACVSMNVEVRKQFSDVCSPLPPRGRRLGNKVGGVPDSSPITADIPGRITDAHHRI